MHLTNTRVSLLSRVECCCHETSEDTRIVDVGIYVPLLVCRLWFRRAADGECTRDRRVPGRKCAAQANIEEKRKRVRLLKVLAPVPRRIHLARPPRTCVCRLLRVFVRIDAYIELVHMRTPAYPICSHANDRRRISLSRDLSVARNTRFPQPWSWRSYVTKTSISLIVRLLRGVD